MSDPTKYVVDFKTIATTQLESSPLAEALAGLRANEARYLSNNYQFEYATYLPSEKPAVVAWVEHVLRTERNIEFGSEVLAVAEFDGETLYWPELYYRDGFSVNVLYEKAAEGKRAVGFKLAVGAAVPPELSSFKFARQRSKLAGEVRGSFFVVKGTYPTPE